MTRDSRFAGARDASAPHHMPLTPRGFPVGVFYLVGTDDDGAPVEEPIRVEGFPYFNVQDPEVV